MNRKKRGLGAQGGHNSGIQVLHAMVCQELHLRCSDPIAWEETRTRWMATSIEDQPGLQVKSQLAKRRRHTQAVIVRAEAGEGAALPAPPLPPQAAPELLDDDAAGDVQMPAEPVCLSALHRASQVINIDTPLEKVAIEQAKNNTRHAQTMELLLGKRYPIQHPLSKC